MDYNKFFTGNFFKTQSIIKTTELAAGGWDAKVIDPALISSPQAFGYVWDRESKFIFMFATERALFAKVSAEISNETAINKQAYTDALCELIKVASEGSNIYANWLDLIGPSFVAYAGTTRTWDLANRMRDGGNFIVCRYKNKMAGVATLRPLFVGSESNQPIEAGELAGLLESVYKTDKENHPEWFE